MMSRDREGAVYLAAMLSTFFSSRIRMCLVIFLVGLASRAAFIIHSRQYLDINEGTEIVNVAHHLAERGTFDDPYKSPTGPTAHVAPGYPFFLSAVYRLFGTSQAG